MRGNHAGDWNKDGLDSVGVYRINAVYLTNTESGAGSLDVAYNYGSVGDIAVAGRWINYCANADPNNPPPPSVCQIPKCEVQLANPRLGYRAPIVNNPPDLRPDGLFKNASGTVEIDKIAIDPLDGQQWQHVANLDTWIQGAVLTGSACGNLLDVSAEYALPSIPWTVPTFTNWPVAVADLCANISNPLAPRQIWGLNKSISNFNYPENMHNGVDFFVDNNDTDVDVISIGKGIIVGIGITGNAIQESTLDLLTHRKWGGSNVIGDERPGYLVIVRYGHFYVLYGHIKELERGLWVGKEVSSGVKLGTIGLSESTAERHLHIEIRTYGQTLPLSNVLHYPSGILTAGLSPNISSAPYHFDLMQFLPNPPGLVNEPLREVIKTSRLVPYPLQNGEDNRAIFTASTSCNLTYVTQLANVATLNKVCVNGVGEECTNGYFYRGFAAYGQSGNALVNPFSIPQLP